MHGGRLQVWVNVSVINIHANKNACKNIIRPISNFPLDPFPRYTFRPVINGSEPTFCPPMWYTEELVMSPISGGSYTQVLFKNQACDKCLSDKPTFCPPMLHRGACQGMSPISGGSYTQVLFKWYDQACDKCLSDEPTFCPPMWYTEELVKVCHLFQVVVILKLYPSRHGIEAWRSAF